MIKIANILLTRKCNLKCSYCRISANIDYDGKPPAYPGPKFHFNSEQPPEYWIKIIDRLYELNKDVFLILYGGEPFLYNGLIDIVKYCNKIGVAYTIISSCNDQLEGKIEEFFSELKKAGQKVLGFTASIDPYNSSDLTVENAGCHIRYKSGCGRSVLFKYKDMIEDPVAEITVTNENSAMLYTLVSHLTLDGITSDITVVDIAKNQFYDFSDVTDESLLMPNNPATKEILNLLRTAKFKGDGFKIHMKDQILPLISENLPANYNCNLENNLTNITIEPNGQMRLCLRIRGRACPHFMADKLLFCDSEMNDFMDRIKVDKRECCEGCIWSCAMMSDIDSGEAIIGH